MKGKYRVIIQNKKIKYDFEIKRNITILKGDSATGKTTLVDMIREYYENGADSGIELYCDRECAVLQGKNWKNMLSMFYKSILFIDEGNSFISSRDFAVAIKNTDNYYVIVTREALPCLPYSVEEIYGIRNSGKCGNLKQIYNKFYQIYGEYNLVEGIHPKKIIVEDSNSGYQFFKSIAEKTGIECISANGKSNIFPCIQKQEDEDILIIADGAAFGPEMDKIINLIGEREKINLYLPESFEWLILKSGIIKDTEVKEILKQPFFYIESKEYMSWERFFTQYLIDKTRESYLTYTKKILNPVYKQESIVASILKIIEKVSFKEEKR